MTQVEKTKAKLESLFNKGNLIENKPIKEVPSEYRALDFFIFSKSFLSAAEIIEREAPNLFVQSLHLSAQSIELALKAAILSCDVKPKEIHDLVKLASKLELLGFSFKQIEISSIVLLNHYFYQDLSTATKFKTRYPTKEQEHLGGPVPDFQVIKDLFNSLVMQANLKCKTIDILTYV